MRRLRMICLAAVWLSAAPSLAAEDREPWSTSPRASCPAGISRGSRLRLTVRALGWRDHVVKVTDCEERRVTVQGQRGSQVIDPASIESAEIARRPALLWPLVSAGAAGGALIGLKLPVDKKAPCTYSSSLGTVCPIGSRAEAIAVGTIVGGVGGFLLGGLLDLKRWQVLPGYSGGPSLSVAVRF